MINHFEFEFHVHCSIILIFMNMDEVYEYIEVLYPTQINPVKPPTEQSPPGMKTSFLLQ